MNWLHPRQRQIRVEMQAKNEVVGAQFLRRDRFVVHCGRFHLDRMLSGLVISILIFTHLASYDSLIRARERGISDVRLIRPGTSSAIGSPAPAHSLGKFPHVPV